MPLALPSTKSLTLEAAKPMPPAAEAKAAENGWKVVIAVADDGGHALLVHRIDGTQSSLTASNAIMLDAQDDRLRGGTGRVVDWSVARRVRELVPNLFLAGGLSPENIAEAILSVNPYAVDACSALEAAPGKKDHQRLREFVRLAMLLNLDAPSPLGEYSKGSPLKSKLSVVLPEQFRSIHRPSQVLL